MPYSGCSALRSLNLNFKKKTKKKKKKMKKKKNIKTIKSNCEIGNKKKQEKKNSKETEFRWREKIEKIIWG